MAARGNVGRMAAFTALWTAVRSAQRPGAPGVGRRLSALPRMVAQGLSGRYPHLDKSRVGLMVLAALYLVSPIDLLPELLLPLIGVGDDVLVLAWLAGAVLSETETFVTWEDRTQGDGSQGDRPQGDGTREDGAAAPVQDRARHETVTGEVVG